MIVSKFFLLLSVNKRHNYTQAFSFEVLVAGIAEKLPYYGAILEI